MANRFKAIPQSRIGWVHLTYAFLIAKYMILRIASSFGNDDRVFVTFLSWKLSDSIAFVEKESQDWESTSRTRRVRSFRAARVACRGHPWSLILPFGRRPLRFDA
jgi:hypothetical protein